MSVALLAVFVLLTLMWYFLVRSRHGNPGSEEMAEDEDTIVFGPGEGPFAAGSHLFLEDEVTNISSIVVATLAAQKAFVSIHTNGLPDKARDNFSIGYIGGYLGEVLRRKSLETSIPVRQIEQVVFEGIFGSSDGGDLHEKFLSLQQSADADVAAGMEVGASDIREWLKNDMNVPFGWSVYVHDSAENL